MSFIDFEGVSFAWPGAEIPAIAGIDLRIEEGEYVAIVGRNGSGKSTLLRLMNGLKTAEAGRVRVADLDAADPANYRRLRSSLVLVFQSPADQIVSTVVEEDVAFGPENLGLDREEIGRRVSESLATVGLEGERQSPPHFLSAGQQQRLAVASALAMQPRCIAFDEATAMLDPPSRRAMLRLMDELNARGVTIIHVTHDMAEAAAAHRVIQLEAGKIAFDGHPDDFFVGQAEGPGLPLAISKARSLGLLPHAREDAESLARRIRSELAPEELPAILAGLSGAASLAPEPSSTPGARAQAVFRMEDVGFRYLQGTRNERRALAKLSFEQPKASLLALVGHTGSGKSTILQLLNALAHAGEGRVLSFGEDPALPKADLRRFRMRAPLAIQRPESALFEPYAGDDVAFGPRNQGLVGEALVARVHDAMNRVGLPFDSFRDRRSRALSGGERRRLALAGVLALDPEALLLDEPTQALDPEAKAAVLRLLRSLVAAGKTVAFSTHSMEEAAAADLVAVLKGGRLLAFGPPTRVFGEDYRADWGIGRPFALELAARLGKAETSSSTTASPVRAGGGASA